MVPYGLPRPVWDIENIRLGVNKRVMPKKGLRVFGPLANLPCPPLPKSLPIVMSVSWVK